MVRLRRVADAELNTRYEIWAALPDNEELRDLGGKPVQHAGDPLPPKDRYRYASVHQRFTPLREGP